MRLVALRLWFFAFLSSFANVGAAQVNYVARFTAEKKTFLLGEPIFCDFSIENTGSQLFGFSVRAPSRALNPSLETEPRFRVTDEKGRPLPDPAPTPCGGAAGSVLYGSATLPAGQTRTERWLLNQWARFSSPGSYHVRAERRLPLFEVDPATQEASKKASAYALAINDLTFEVVKSTREQLSAVFQPYLHRLEDGHTSEQSQTMLAEAMLVLTTLPQEAFEAKLEAMARRAPGDQRWDRKQALDGLARLNTRSAWEAILGVARSPSEVESVRSYAILLLAEKGDPVFLPALLEMLGTAPPEIRGDILRGLGFFRDLRANQVLFGQLHSKSATARMNSILGLKNLESRDVIPALIAMLSDPDAQVRQVANFALQSLTGQHLKLSAKGTREETDRVAREWHAWLREKGATTAVTHQRPCHDW